MVIGITGNSGSGKTYVSKILSEKINWEVVNADKIVKELSTPGNLFYDEIIIAFGIQYINKNKTLDKAKLSKLIFSNKEAKSKLDDITEKYIVPEIIRNIKENSIIDVPLLFESGLDKNCDITIAVFADEDIKINRIITRDNITRELAISRLKAQSKDDYYKSKADYIIYNNKDNLEEQIDNIIFMEKLL